MTDFAAREARRALVRLRRAAEKATQELSALADALRHAESADFPADDFAHARSHLDALESFVEEQEQRLDEKILNAGGIEPGRVRRTGG